MSLPVPLDVLSSSDALLRTYPNPKPEPASLPVPNPTKSIWITKSSGDEGSDPNPLANEGNEGPLTTEVDVVIIGSGISGVSAAFHLGRLSRAEDRKMDV